MPRKTKDGQPFNQSKYIEEWAKENMSYVGAQYKKEFVQSFKAACKKLGVSQSEIFRNAMQEAIDKADGIG